MQSSMSDVQALLSVDAGRVPPGTVAFFARDPERTKRRVLAVFAVLVGSAAVASLMAGLSRPPIALLALATIGLVVMALPPERDPETAGHSPVRPSPAQRARDRHARRPTPSTTSARTRSEKRTA